MRREKHHRQQSRQTEQTNTQIKQILTHNSLILITEVEIVLVLTGVLGNACDFELSLLSSFTVLNSLIASELIYLYIGIRLKEREKVLRVFFFLLCFRFKAYEVYRI